MNPRIRIAFLCLIVLQALHSMEEFVFKFYEQFPPMVVLYRNTPTLARPGFILFNSILVLIGFVSLIYWVWPSRRRARTVVWIWIGIEAFNVIAHCIWAGIVRGYNPGLVTGLAFVPALAYLIRLLNQPGTQAV